MKRTSLSAAATILAGSIAVATAGSASARAAENDHDPTIPTCPSVSAVHDPDGHAPFLYLGREVVPVGSSVTGTWGFWSGTCWVPLD
ncbi:MULTISPECIES: hypothetical protein [Actinomycetes]|jgi:hypothetical protein|uniref:Secreted protein n=1 Tax=Williamsia serinedens TaxID=391736 RepID=A0ABT1H324_9NOCA|nr:MULTISPECIES: hypothetical protein [Actinomycetes]MBE7190841.1 hypothetical protein [Jatrophihabitans endophyticus]MBE7194669.1 hypothetical protein [Gordonia polyisoprenivorans]MCP2160148.1 hypothetical protein [Williamsia serinedens]